LFDRVEITVRAGNGGDGAVSFRREKYIPFGGPDGGDGGDGGNVVIMADPAVTSLGVFRHKGVYKAGNGENGRGKKQHGKNGDDLVLRVPVGTVALDKNKVEEALIADCEQAGQREVIASGGKGGLGNIHYVSSTNQAPRIAQKGEAGEELSLTLELRLIADAGIIGYPNAGKSTLLAAASAAKPKIASYPFTTLEPVLGVIGDDRQRFVMAEIPGLIDGAHLGKGLGHDFLRHIMRTKILVHLIDGTSGSPVEDMVRVNTELSLFDETLARKQQIVVVNKIDLPEVQAKLTGLRTDFKSAGIRVHFISAVTGEGVPELMAEALKVLNQVAAGAKAERKVTRAVFRPQPRGSGISVQKKEGVFILGTPELERIVARVDVADPEVQQQLQRQMDRLGVRKALEKAGIKPGDKVSCGDYEWEW